MKGNLYTKFNRSILTLTAGCRKTESPFQISAFAGSFCFRSATVLGPKQLLSMGWAQGAAFLCPTLPGHDTPVREGPHSVVLGRRVGSGMCSMSSALVLPLELPTGLCGIEKKKLKKETRRKIVPIPRRWVSKRPTQALSSPPFPQNH